MAEAEGVTVAAEPTAARCVYVPAEVLARLYAGELWPADLFVLHRLGVTLKPAHAEILAAIRRGMAPEIEALALARARGRDV